MVFAPLADPDGIELVIDWRNSYLLTTRVLPVETRRLHQHKDLTLREGHLGDTREGAGQPMERQP
jgi:hypothetical protein